jgi:hypothetical protein
MRVRAAFFSRSWRLHGRPRLRRRSGWSRPTWASISPATPNSDGASMTLDEALRKALGAFDAITAQQMDAYEADLRARGATDDECAAVRVVQRANLLPARCRLLETVRSVWLTGSVVQ